MISRFDIAMLRNSGLSILALALSIPAYAAVTVPSGGSGKLYVAYDGSDVTTTTVGSDVFVDSWNDQATKGGDDDASSTGSNRPLLVTKDTGNGLHPVLQFDGTDDFLQTTFSSGSLAQTNVIFIVAQRTNVATNSHLIDGLSSTGRHALFTRQSTGFPISHGMFAGSQLINNNVAANQDVFEVYTLFFNTTNSQLRINGTQVLGTGNAGTHQIAGLTIGSRFNAPTGTLEGDIAELLVYDSALNTEEIEGIEGYLTNKYLVPEPTSLALLGLGGLMMLPGRKSGE